MVYLLLLGGLFGWLCFRAYQALRNVTTHTILGGLSHRKFRKQRPFRPKYQFRYHWFKSRMKRKRNKKFRKPPVLKHLTWRHKIKVKTAILTCRLILTLLQVGCRVEHFCRNALVVEYDGPITRSVIVAWLRKLLLWGNVTRRDDEVCYQADLPNPVPAKTRFDTDSIKIYLDTACSRTMSDRKDHFVGLRPWSGPQSYVIGVGQGALKVESEGTFVFNVEDDTGQLQHIQIPNSVYVPDLKRTLICPQHWAKEDGDIQATTTYLINGANGCWMVWNKGNTRKWVPHDPITNTPSFYQLQVP